MDFGQGLFMEMFITAALVLTVLMLAAESKTLHYHQDYTFQADETPMGSR